MAVMGSVLRGVWLVCCGLLLAEALPWRSKLGMRDSQACGDRLADIMALVCSERGYNVAFIPERSNGRRFRRGIVDECCYKSCPRVMLEQYCQTDSTEDRVAVPIRKRSDGVASSELLQPVDISKQINTEAGAVKPIAEEKQTETISTSVTKEGDENYKLFNLLAPPQKQSTRNLNTKLTPNDTTEEEPHRRGNRNPPLRHKSHHHSSRQLHSRKATSKTKKTKDVSAENSQTFQIGMVKPYFARQALASYHSNYVHRT